MNARNKKIKTLPVGKVLRPANYDINSPSFYVVSEAEFNELKATNAPEVEGLSYDEYIELEHECWTGMLHVQLMQPWERPIPTAKSKKSSQRLSKAKRDIATFMKSPAFKQQIRDVCIASGNLR